MFVVLEDRKNNKTSNKYMVSSSNMRFRSALFLISGTTALEALRSQKEETTVKRGDVEGAEFL